ncbi:MAG: PEP-CTERM sorting domain-containing protein [Planctomycetaceae bacterium]|nr:PEP-CTERM sorting domain-containing protein [Planctomycetaceae bacterium]
MTKSQDQSVKDLWDGFQFTFTKQTDSNTSKVVGTQLTFSLTQTGIDAGYAGGQDGVKFKDFELLSVDLGSLSELFVGNLPPATSKDGWTNGGWATNSTGTSYDLTFADGVDWDYFASLVAKDGIKIEAHVQSINVLEGKDSINGALFTYDGGSTPEPASLLIFGIGAASLGLLRRRK